MTGFINIDEFTYDLPLDKIATHPLEKRDESKLLVYKSGNIQHSTFKHLSHYLPQESLLVFNNTKVIPARLLFAKDTGAIIEVFLLTPVKPSPIMADVMMARNSCTWECTIGNLKRWKENSALDKKLENCLLTANLIDREKGIVEFSWDAALSFAEVVTLAGVTPLPPYLKREASADDLTRYQTIYSKFEGAVAAPTAGLHFTEEVFQTLKAKQITTDFVTLHVSAGTFQPVKVTNALEHTMHHEQVVIHRSTIHRLLTTKAPVIPVGTTSMRTLESLHWYGVKLLTDPTANFIITQDDPFTTKNSITTNASLEAVLTFMDLNQLEELTGTTSIYIHPGYTFKICNGLITNFHLPGSTLMLLVAALLGENWKQVYEEALQENYRFLSYGDSSLLLP